VSIETEDDRLRVAAINFLNPAPLMWDFEHEPLRSELAKEYSLRAMAPSKCAEELAAGDAEIGLVPIAAYATIPGLSIIPGCTVASKGPIRSLILVFHEFAGLEAVRTIAADTSSQATLAYVQILFKKYWCLPASFAPHPPHLDAMLEACDAAILIGDPALLALESRDRREQRTGERLAYLDLGTAWREATGMPWVSAFWAVRSSAIASARRAQVREDFLASREHGLLHLEEIVEEWTPRIGVTRETIRQYLTTNIHYVLDDECLVGVEFFLRVARECGVLPAAPVLRML
jgi:chorismate dehydratase